MKACGNWAKVTGLAKAPCRGKKKLPRNAVTLMSPSFSVVAYDFGVKYNILRNLAEVGCRVKVVPADTSAEDVLSLNPDGIFLSNGPGDPDAVPYAKDKTSVS